MISDQLYEETKLIKTGVKNLKPEFEELSEWFKKMYSITLLNAALEPLEGSDGRYRLRIIMNNAEDYHKMHISRFKINKDYQSAVAYEFKRIASSYHILSEKCLENLWVVFNDFSDEARIWANWDTVKKADEILQKKFPDIWHIEAIFSATVVFFYTDAQLKQNEKSGLFEKVKQEYFEILKQHDELNYSVYEEFVLQFDSKENLDKNYQESMFYYTR